MDLPLREKVLGKTMVKEMVEDLMVWHASLLQSVLDRQNHHPSMAYARKRAALDQKDWQMSKRESKAMQQMIEGNRNIHSR